MFDALMAGKASAFETVAELEIRRRMPSSFTLVLPIQWPKGEHHKAQLTLSLAVHRLRVQMLTAGPIHVKLELALALERVQLDLELNDLFAADKPIPTTNVKMPAVPPTPLDWTFDPPVPIGAPQIDLNVVRFEDAAVQDTRELRAIVDLASLVVQLNPAGLAQVLASYLARALREAIEGAFGKKYLGAILGKVLDFVELVIQHALEVAKVPNVIAATLVSTIEAAVRDMISKQWLHAPFPIARVPAKIMIAPKSTTGKSGVFVTITSVGAEANIGCKVKGQVLPELVLGLTLASK